MMTRAQAVLVARSFLGTPYVLGGRLKGAGVDCATLLGEYLIEIGRTTEQELIAAGFYRPGGGGHPFSGDWFLHTSREEYLRGLMLFGKLVAESLCRPAVAAQPGDLALFRSPNSKRFNHGAIVTSWPFGIHAAIEGVREVDLTTNRLTGFRPMEIFDPFAKMESEP